MTRNMIIWIWLTAFLHPVIFPCVLHTAKEIEKWWDKKRVLWHVEQLRKDGYNKGKDGPNADRHLCKTCIYRGRHDQVGNCSYIEIEGHSRGMPAAECTVYVKGRKRKALW